MHYLHKILVYIPDVVPDVSETDHEVLIRRIRSYAEEVTDGYYNTAFDWRETDTAGRWSYDYPVNVLLASDDNAQFIAELDQVLESQSNEIQYCLHELKKVCNGDLEKIAEGIWKRPQYPLQQEDGFSSLTAYYLHCLADYLYGEYRHDSYFYNSNDYSARLYPDKYEEVKASLNDWALVMFDYHN